MATKFASREVLELATEDDCSGWSNSENRESIEGAIHAYRGKTRLSTEGLEDVVAVMGETIPHLFLADSLQLTYLTSRLGGAESFATSISFEKLDRSCSQSCPYFWRQFLAILAASQPCFVDIPLIRSNIKGSTKHFSSQNTPLEL